MQCDGRKILFVISIMVILITSVVGQIIPVSGYQLEKRDFSILHDQHLTVKTGNTMICGDHMCQPGEWNKLSENLNTAQIIHGSAKHFPKTSTIPAQNYNSTYSVSNSYTPQTPSSVSPNSTPITVTPTPPSTPIPTPIPTPLPVPYSVCQTVNATLTNSTVSINVIAKIMAQLGCS
ncbi:MAG: hypothetical protein WA833_03950 [Nitrosotalea sp.]